MKHRDFKYKELNFHLNDNYNIHNKPPRAEFEGRYKLLMRMEDDDGNFIRWQGITTVDSKEYAMELVAKRYDNLRRYGTL